MAASTTGRVMNWFTISEELSRTVTAGEEIDVTDISAVAFDNDVAVTIGTLTTPFELPAGTPLGVDVRTTTISVDVASFMFAMSI